MTALSTLEMIENIKDGQKAKVIDCDIVVYCDRAEGIVVVKNGSSKKLINRHLILSKHVLDNFKWKLQPIPITLDEAVERLNKGQSVKLYTSHDKTLLTVEHINDMVSVFDFYKGVWYNSYDVNSIDDLEW